MTEISDSTPFNPVPDPGVITTQGYIISKRIDSLQEYLQQGNKTIEELAALNGTSYHTAWRDLKVLINRGEAFLTTELRDGKRVYSAGKARSMPHFRMGTRNVSLRTLTEPFIKVDNYRSPTASQLDSFPRALVEWWTTVLAFRSEDIDRVQADKELERIKQWVRGLLYNLQNTTMVVAQLVETHAMWTAALASEILTDPESLSSEEILLAGNKLALEQESANEEGESTDD